VRVARVLVVDDDEDVRELLSRQLAQHGHEVVLASGYDAALAAMTPVVPDVLVTDLSMHPHTGAQLLREVAARHPAVGRILFTGERGEGVRRAGSYAHVVLQKGGALAELSVSVTRWLEARR